jgi:hypothetical protein
MDKNDIFVGILKVLAICVLVFLVIGAISLFLAQMDYDMGLHGKIKG